MRVLITGGTGLIGRLLCRVLLADGHEIIVLSRSPQAQKDVIPAGIHLHEWDGRSAEGWGHLIQHDTAIINLAGENTAALRWAGIHKQRILESRIAAAQAVAEAIENAPEKPRILLQASAASYYGDCENDIIIEDSPAGEGWRAEACQQWEQITASLNVRQCILRIGIVLDTTGGALPLMLLGSRFYDRQAGSGQQWIPWVHNQDVALALRFLMKHDSASGAFNIVAPNPQPNSIFMRELSSTLKTTTWIPLPEIALRRALGETAKTALDSQRAIPYRLTQLGYQFRFPTLEDTLHHLIG